jgi:hypothetical protein
MTSADKLKRSSRAERGFTPLRPARPPPGDASPILKNETHKSTSVIAKSFQYRQHALRASPKPLVTIASQHTLSIKFKFAIKPSQGFTNCDCKAYTFNASEQDTDYHHRNSVIDESNYMEFERDCSKKYLKT